ncbi:exopolyphosphatase-related protein [Candidatus Magnetomorum sp. HK-1]|nr:exopolyphosphatase-related protein [Candidatus Magnetomorum sp. HK-1]
MRLITRSDFDGLVCAVLLVEAGIVDEYKFVHPKDVQDGKIEVTENDVLTNIPYVEGCGLWFDHHSSENERLKLNQKFQYKGLSKEAPSCARVIYDYYGGDERFGKFDQIGLMEGVDKSDSGQLSIDEILNPKGWILLSFIMDPRTGLGRYRDYRISNYQLMEKMIQYCQSMSADEILQLPDVQERIARYYEQEKAYEKMVLENSTVKQNILIIDLRDVEEFVSGNRFKEYVLFPEQNISLRIIWGFKKQNVVFTAGHSIVNRTSKTNIGSLMLKYGGGGHRAVGTCQIPFDQWEKVRSELIEKIISDG